MNVVLRITSKKFVYSKTIRPFVQKYQDINAPLERIHTSIAFTPL